MAMLDTYLSLADFQKLDLDDQAVLRWIASRLKLSTAELRKLPLEQQWERIEEQAMRSEGIGVAEIRPSGRGVQGPTGRASPLRAPALSETGRAFTAGRGGGIRTAPWVSLCPLLRVEPVSGDHYTMLCKPDVELLAERLGRQLREALGGGEMTRNA